jgi:hypothetical protein
MREFRSGRKAVEDLPRVGRPCLDDIDGAMVQKLNKYPFHSCHSLAEDVGVAPSTIWTHLMESLGFASRCLHWLPHELTDDLREKRIAIGRQLLEVLEEAQSTDFRGLITGDESWFHLSYASRAVWTMSRDEAPTKEKQAISTRNFMLTVFSSVDGFHVAEFLPTVTRFDTVYFVDILFHYSPRSCQWGPLEGAKWFSVSIAITLTLTIPRGVEHQLVIMDSLGPPAIRQSGSCTERLLPLRHPKETAGKQGTRGARSSSGVDITNSGRDSQGTIDGRFQRLG